MKAIAMKATQEDWDSVKDLVKKYEEISSFEEYPYLLTNYGNALGLVSNNDSRHKDAYNRTVYETFDRAIFLEALGIVEEKIWKGGEIQKRFEKNGPWFTCLDSNYYRLKPINPELKQLQELSDKLGYKIEKL
jgi:hypothetical protein